MTRRLAKGFRSVALLLAGAGALASPAFAGEPEAAALRAYCETELTMPAGVCDCLLKKFGEMNDSQQALQIARLRQDNAAAGALQRQLPPDEALEAGMFLTRETPVCARG